MNRLVRWIALDWPAPPNRMRSTIPLLAVTLGLSLSASAAPFPDSPTSPDSPLFPSSPSSSCPAGSFLNPSTSTCLPLPTTDEAAAARADRLAGCSEGWAWLEDDDCGELMEQATVEAEERAVAMLGKAGVEERVEVGGARKGMQKVLRAKPGERGERS